MALLLDTDVIIEGEKGRLDLGVWLKSRTPEQVEIAAITVAELWHGVERETGTYRSERERYLRTIVELPKPNLGHLYPACPIQKATAEPGFRDRTCAPGIRLDHCVRTISWYILCRRGRLLKKGGDLA